MRAISLPILALLVLVACQKNEAAATKAAAPAETAAVASSEAVASEPQPVAAEPVNADDDSNTRIVSIAVFADKDGVAVGGYDPVSYFSGQAQKGDPAIVSIVDGAVYRFASLENKAAFDAEPSKFRPQYGGFCAYGASQGAKFPTDPETGTVVDGKLYFNKNKSVAELWQKDRAALIAKADETWPSIVYDEPRN